MSKLKYLPQIDSLRAISVVGVIIYHLEINLFKTRIFSGGYIGVDIFFLISGYLITGILYYELLEEKKISFSNFYLRRIRRIIPPLLFLLFIVLIFSLFFTLPQDLIKIAEITISNLFSIANIYFYYNHIFYWGDSLEINPFLHTWSLSVEEQYYFIFPIVFLIFFKIDFIKKNIFSVLSVSLLFCFLLSNYLSFKHYNFSFYMLPSRVFEFLLGSILVILKINNKFKFNYKYVNSFYGLIIIILSYIFFNDYTPTPSFWTLIPLLGAAIIIIDERNKFSHILQNKYIIFIGLISYSLYLWHYPIIVFLKYFYIKKSFLYYFSFIFFLITFSLTSFFFIEQPFRNKLRVSTEKMLIILSPFFIFVFLISWYFIKTDNFYQKLNPIIKNTIEKKELKPIYIISINHNWSI